MQRPIIYTLCENGECRKKMFYASTTIRLTCSKPCRRHVRGGRKNRHKLRVGMMMVKL